MKKLLFIIPKVLFCFTLLLIILCHSFNVIAADGVDGCHIVTPGGQHRNYHTPFLSGAGSPSEWIATSASGAGYNLNTTSRCIETVGAFCTVYKFGTGSSPVPADILYTGNYAIMIDCPIDDYIPALFIFTLGIAIVYIRGVPNLVNESKHHHGSI